MYELLKAKLLILPDWLAVALDAHRLRPTDVITREGLESILSAADVQFYQKQCRELLDAVNGGNGQYSPVQAALDSLEVLHTNSVLANSLGNAASGLNEYVKINALYGKNHAGYDFFNGRNMLGYLPRQLGATLESTVIVDPYIERCDNDLFVLKFSLGLYQERAMQTFISNTLQLFMGEYGFDEVAKTKLFDFYTLMSDK